MRGKLGSPELSKHGLIVPGNINLMHRPLVRTRDGVATVRSMSFGTGRGEVLVPTVANGRLLSDQQAMQRYRKTGRHLGIFASPQAADVFAERLHRSQQRLYRRQIMQALKGEAR